MYQCDAPDRGNLRAITQSTSICIYTHENMTNLFENNNFDLTELLFPKLIFPAEISVHIYPTVSEQYSQQDYILSELIEGFRTSDTLEEMVSRVRTATSEKDRRTQKELIPVFRPCYYNDSFTGLIQFDIDVYNLENSERLKKLLIDKIPCLVYAFISPSGGLKFAVLTDIINIDKDNYSIAYYIAKDRVNNLLSCCADGVNELAIEFDDRMKTMSYLCFMSYDPDAYYNPEPAQRMDLSRDVNKKILETKLSSIKPVQPQNISTTSKPTEDNDKLSILRAIDAIAENKNVAFNDRPERIKFANAVVNVFGLVDGYDIILNTVRLFGGDNEYLNSVIQKGNNFGVGTILFYARRCGFKEITENFKANSTSGNTERFELVPKDTTRTKRYSTEEATRQIDLSVQRFFDDGISTQLIVEMGIGKTQITLKKAIEYMDRLEGIGEKKKIAIFVPSHKLGKESLEKLLGYETEEFIGDFDNEGERFSLGPKRTHKVIGGFGKHCRKLQGIPEEERKGLIRNPWECEQCDHKNTFCWYVHQFFFEDNLIRIYPHNFLFQPSNYDKKYHPDLVIIDEDPSGHCIIKRTYDVNNGKIWMMILEKGFDAIDVSDISRDIKLLKLQIDGAKGKLSKAGADSSFVINYNNLLSELDDLNILMNERWKVSVYDNKVHVHHKQEIDKKWLNAPILYLNGTGNKEISNAIFGPDKFEITEEIRVQYNPKVKVYQLMNQSFSMSQFEATEEQKGEKLKQDVFDLISYFYHYKGACFVSYGSIIKEYLAKHPSCDPERFMYYGDTRGKKTFEDKSIIVAIGRHYKGVEKNRV
jgi:hypothetical protein